MSIADIGAEAADASSGQSQSIDPDDYERYDVSGHDFAKIHPGPTAVGGTAVALRYLPGDPDNEGLDRGDVGLVVDDPFIVSEGMGDVTIFENTSGTGDDYKIVNLDDEDTEHLEGTGVMFGTDTFIGEPVEGDDLPSTLIIKLTGNAGRSATSCLDVNALGSADVKRDETGEVEINPNHGYPEQNDKLIEYIDTEDDEYEPPRFARDPELRPDVEGTEVVFMLQRLSTIKDDYDGDSYWSTVFANVDDERATELAEQYATSDGDDRTDPDAFFGDVNGMEMLELSPTSEFSPSPTLARATKFLEKTDEGGHYPTDEELEALREEQGISAS